jgi:hypothetical protein
VRTVSIRPSHVVMGTMRSLRHAGIDTNLTPTNVYPALAAATDLLRALGVAAPATTPAMPATPGARAGSTVGRPAMWARADVREALARRDVGALYEILRRHGVPLHAVAAATGQSLPQVWAAIAGRRTVSADVLARIADGLGMPREHLELPRHQPPADPASRAGARAHLRLIKGDS